MTKKERRIMQEHLRELKYAYNSYTNFNWNGPEVKELGCALREMRELMQKLNVEQDV